MGSRTVTARERYELLVVIAALTLLAWINRFVQDDAFISFRYADHLARGFGLVWNRGERIEGFTNFLYTLTLSGLMRVGAEPVAASYWLGLPAFALTLWVTHKLTVQLLVARDVPLRRWPLVAVSLLGLNFSFSCYATGGLETAWQSLAFTAMVYARGWVRETGRSSRTRLFLVSLLFAFAIGTRLDSALIVVVVALSMSVDILRGEGGSADKWRAFACLVSPGAALVGALFAFKLSYFGTLVPNTFHAKSSSLKYAFEQGAPYVWGFIRHYTLLPQAILALGYIPLSLRARQHGRRTVLGVIALWLSYVIWVGGDFMEFRMIMPILPVSLVYLVTILAGLRVIWAAPIAVATVLGSVRYAEFARRVTHLGEPAYVESIHGLAGHIEVQDWPQIGRAFGELTDHDPNVVIAVAAAGAIPYYSRLTTVDLHGLNDAWIARNGVPNGNRPGHRRIAPLSYLLDRKVTFVFRSRSEQLTSYTLKDASIFVKFAGAKLPPDACIVELPVSPGRTVHALYLTRNPILDARLREKNVHFLPINPDP